MRISWQSLYCLHFFGLLFVQQKNDIIMSMKLLLCFLVWLERLSSVVCVSVTSVSGFKCMSKFSPALHCMKEKRNIPSLWCCSKIRFGFRLFAADKNNVSSFWEHLSSICHQKMSDTPKMNSHGLAQYFRKNTSFMIQWYSADLFSLRHSCHNVFSKCSSLLSHFRNAWFLLHYQMWISSLNQSRCWKMQCILSKSQNVCSDSENGWWNNSRSNTIVRIWV